MKSLMSIICVFYVMAVYAAGPAFAEKKFHITHRQDNLTIGELTATGNLFVYVLNASGGPVKDVAIWIEGQNNVTFDNRVLTVGDLADGEPRGVWSEFKVPKEIVPSDDDGGQTTWKVEFTNASGERIVTDTAGERIR